MVLNVTLTFKGDNTMRTIEKSHYPKYTWVGNRISEKDMSTLYHFKQETKIPITKMVAEAVKEYISRHKTPEVIPDN